ncbi:hypothetical protein [Mycobacteroides abscessus]|uniref:hypothetical protein n=1 Tax=unclassified Desemzia TaxID=2685243 RepID=UPI0009C8B01B|nr:Uncharacterised protein [Mycobacteroides abscessus subsp. abscessus]
MFGIKKKNYVIVLGSLVEGLSLEEETDIFLKLSSDELYMYGLTNGKKQEFTLSIDKINSIVHKTETEMQQYAKQSVPGMMIGNATFGLLGAMIGGRVKTKEKKQKTDFILINYVSNDEPNTIVLITRDPNKLKLVQLFEKIKPTQSKNVYL